MTFDARIERGPEDSATEIDLPMVRKYFEEKLEYYRNSLFQVECLEKLGVTTVVQRPSEDINVTVVRVRGETIVEQADAAIAKKRASGLRLERPSTAKADDH